jgi:hypothetical protein
MNNTQYTIETSIPKPDVKGGNYKKRPEKWIKQPGSSETQYTETEIRGLMQGYRIVKDISRITKGTFLRYWVRSTTNPDEYKFRKGGFLFSMDKKGRYVVLRSYHNTTWSVNLQNGVQFFYKPPSNDKINFDNLPKINPTEINKRPIKTGMPEISIKLKDLDEPNKNSKKQLVKNTQDYSISYESDYSLPEEPKKKPYIAVKKLK